MGLLNATTNYGQFDPSVSTDIFNIPNIPDVLNVPDIPIIIYISSSLSVRSVRWSPNRLGDHPTHNFFSKIIIWVFSMTES